MKEINKEKTMEKWKNLIGNMGLSDERKCWIDDYTQRQFDCGVDTSTIHPGGPGSTQSLFEDFPTMLPVDMRVAAQTIGNDLVSVQPMGVGLDMEKIMSDVKAENRDRVIDSIVEDKEFEPMKPEDHPDYKKGFPKGKLFYIDYKYGK